MPRVLVRMFQKPCDPDVLLEKTAAVTAQQHDGSDVHVRTPLVGLANLASHTKPCARHLQSFGLRFTVAITEL